MTDLRGVERASLYVRLEAFEQDIKPFEAHLGFEHKAALGPKYLQ